MYVHYVCVCVSVCEAASRRLPGAFYKACAWLQLQQLTSVCRHSWATVLDPE